MPGVVEQDLTGGVGLGGSIRVAGPGSPDGLRNARPCLALPSALSCLSDTAVVLFAGLGSLYAAAPGSGWQGLSGVVLVAAVALLAAAGMWERGLYSVAVLFSRRLHLTRLTAAWLQAVGLGVLLTLALLAVLRQSGQGGMIPGTADIGATFDGFWLPLFVAGGLAGLGVLRVGRRRVLARRAPPRHAVVVGATALCQQVLERLDREGHGGIDVVGIVEHDVLLRSEGQPSLRSFYGRTVLGGIPALLDLVRRDAIDTVIVALPWAAEGAIRDIVQILAASPVDIYIAPSLDGVTFNGRSVRTIGGVPMLQAGQRPLQGWRAAAKRAEDLLAGSIILLLALPALLAIAAAIKLTSQGPVLFRQRRVGFNNKIFEVYKFRTMYTHLTDADAAQQTRKGDPRVTRVGSILRRTSLDELPQILNVLRGDMSLVGPRPHALQTRAGGRRLEEVAPEYPARHRVRPGITGWAQVNGYRGELDTVEKVINRVDHDLYYIDNWSLGLDLRILWQTARLMISDNNAY
jgi:Undecaprenyl-phosphate glucose phosphotransferase